MWDFGSQRAHGEMIISFTTFAEFPSVSMCIRRRTFQECHEVGIKVTLYRE